MRIYYIAHCRFPSERAHAIQIAKMAEAMRLAGGDVHLLVPHRKNRIAQSAREFYTLKTDLPVRYLPVLDCYGWGRLGYVLGGLSFLFSYSLFLISRKLHGEKFLLYTIDMDEFSFIGVSFFSAPFAIEIHGAKKYGVLLNQMFSRAHAILTINNLIKDELIRTFRIPEDRILVHPNGTDIALFSRPIDRNAWRAKWGIAPNARLALYVGKCYDWKGMEIFSDAFHSLPEVTFAFVGCTEAEMKRITAINGEPRNVLFFGQRPYAEMPRWMKSADLLLVISTKKNEYSYSQTSPMKLFEYMASGVPVLVPNTPAIRDMIPPRHALFYEPDIATSFVAALRDALTDITTSQEIAARAGEYVKTFSWEHRAQMILDRFPR